MPSRRCTKPGPLPADIIWRIERRLNDPDCRDASTPDTCAATKRARYEQSRLGWAAQTLNAICYDNHLRPRRYPAQCERRYSWGSAKEDYVLPEAHTVAIGIAPEALRGQGGGAMRLELAAAQTRRPDRDAHLAVPGQAHHRAGSVFARQGIVRSPVKVKLPDGHELSAPVVVEDIFLVALGDSFASGESNPDRPVTFSDSREMVYDPTMLRDETVSALAQPSRNSNFDLGSANEKHDPKSLPKRRMADEESRPHAAAGIARIRDRLRAARGAMGQRRLPPLAIRLSGPGRHPARAGKPPSRGDALSRFACSGRGSGRGAVPGHAVARGHPGARAA